MGSPIVSNFAATRALDEASLRALLAGGAPEQRIWAAWAIALRIGSVLPHLVAHVAGEPNAGVRRALLVVLAGHGELDVLVALARHDPSLDVRGHALQLVTTFAAQGAIPLEVVREAHAAGPAELRRAIATGIPRGAPDALRPLIVESLTSGTPDEQLEAFDAALRIYPRAAMQWLRRATGGLATEAWMRLQPHPPAAILDALLHTDSTLRVRGITTLTAIPIGELAPLAIDGDAHTFEQFREREDFAAAPPELLARGVLAGCAVRFLEQLTSQLVAAPATSLTPYLPRLRDHVAARLAAIAQGSYLPDEAPAWRWPAVQRYRALAAALDRLG